MNGFNSVDRDGPLMTGKKVEGLFNGPRDPVLAGDWKNGLTLRSNLEAPADSSIELDMGMGSRLEGFKNCGHR